MTHGEPLPEDCLLLRPSRFFRLTYGNGRSVLATMFDGVLHFDLLELGRQARFPRPSSLLERLDDREWKLWPTPWSKGQPVAFVVWTGAVKAFGGSKRKGVEALVDWLMRTSLAIHAAAEATAADRMRKEHLELLRLYHETAARQDKAIAAQQEAKAEISACLRRLEATVSSIRQDAPCHLN